MKPLEKKKKKLKIPSRPDTKITQDELRRISEI